MKYKIGDKVIIKHNFSSDEEEMQRYRGRVVTIYNIPEWAIKFKQYIIKEDDHKFAWSEEYIKCLAEDIMDEVITNADSFFEGCSDEVKHNSKLDQKDIDIMLGVVSGDNTKFTEEQIKASQKRYRELQEENSHRCNLIVTNSLSVEEEMFERIAKLEKRIEEQNKTVDLLKYSISAIKIQNCDEGRKLIIDAILDEKK